jgi:hypothetical protein
MHPLTIRLAGIFTLAAMLTGCAATEVRSYLARGADLHSYRTYNWQPIEPRSTGDPRLDSNQFFEQRVQTAVDAQLAGKGFERTVSAPHFLVHYHMSVTQQIQISPSEHGVVCEECRAEVYDQGTLLIDLVDARTGLLAWRGWAKGGIDGVIDNQQWMEQRIDEAVRRIMREFPPGL